MKILRVVGVVLLVVVVLLVFGACATGTESVLSRFGGGGTDAPEAELFWAGTGRSYIHEDGQWVRTPHQDYVFHVHQRRFADRWESQKVQNRVHSAYDGGAGPADQQHFFLLDLGNADAAGTIPLEVSSTYGAGSGTTDPEFRSATLEFAAAGVSRLAPYNRFRIDQEYDYEGGRLSEEVLLFKQRPDGSEEPFVRIIEEARLFVPGRFTVPSTVGTQPPRRLTSIRSLRPSPPGRP